VGKAEDPHKTFQAPDVVDISNLVGEIDTSIVGTIELHPTWAERAKPTTSFTSCGGASYGKVVEFGASLELLSQPDGLRSSARPCVTLLVAIFGGHLCAFQGASSASVAYLATQPRKLALQLSRSLVENFSNLVTQL
jgi:hypothetical protein